MYYGGHITPNCLDIHEPNLPDGPLSYYRLYASLYRIKNGEGVGEQEGAMIFWNCLHVFNL
jgi:hypothetical protein